MITPELRAYVQKRVAEGASQEEITKTLLAAGWQETDIKEALETQPAQKRIRLLPILIVSLIGILLIGGGVFGFWYFIQDPPPEKVIARMMEESASITSFAYSGGIRVEVGEKTLEEGTFFDLGGIAGFLNAAELLLSPPEPSSEETMVISIDFNGVADGSNPKTPKAQVSLDMRVDASPEGKFAVGVETRLIGEDIYAKLTRFEFDPAIPFIDGIILLLRDQWFKVDRKSLEELNGYSGAFTPGASQFSDEELKRLEDALRNARIIRVTQTLPNDTIEGAKTFHYKFALNTEGLRSYMVEIMNVMEAKNASNEELSQIKALLESEAFNEVLDMIVEGFMGDIWIGKKDFFPYRVSAGFALKDAESQKEAAIISFLFNMKDFNKPVSVEAPADAKSLEALLEELFTSSFSEGGGRIYKSHDPAFCARAFIACEEGLIPFSDATGCGCQPISPPK